MTEEEAQQRLTEFAKAVGDVRASFTMLNDAMAVTTQALQRFGKLYEEATNNELQRLKKLRESERPFPKGTTMHYWPSSKWGLPPIACGGGSGARTTDVDSVTCKACIDAMATKFTKQTQCCFICRRANGPDFDVTWLRPRGSVVELAPELAKHMNDDHGYDIPVEEE